MRASTVVLVISLVRQQVTLEMHLAGRAHKRKGREKRVLEAQAQGTSHAAGRATSNHPQPRYVAAPRRAGAN